MNSLKYKLMRFMSGRYGSDKLNYFLLGSYLFLWIINLIVFSQIASLIIDIIMLLLVVAILYRMFSKNIYKRRRENEIYLSVSSKVLPDFKLLKLRWQERKTHAYKKCPECKAVLRLRKLPGEHTAICPKCRAKVKVKF